jgi:hypothetical protein
VGRAAQTGSAPVKPDETPCASQPVGNSQRACRLGAAGCHLTKVEGAATLDARRDVTEGERDRTKYRRPLPRPRDRGTVADWVRSERRQRFPASGLAGVARDTPRGDGHCARRVQAGDVAPDPAFPSPGPDSTSIHILVWEAVCASGRPTTGRMSAPAVTFGPTTVTIKIGVRPLGGVQACPGPPGTPAVLILPEPLGARTLLDGGRTPVGPPSPGFIPASPGA